MMAAGLNKDISDVGFNRGEESRPLDKKELLTHMIRELPETPWANIEILDWLPQDDELTIEYRFADTGFGQVLVANTPKGICYLGLEEDEPEDLIVDLNKRFPRAECIENSTSAQMQVLDFLAGKRGENIIFHLRGTAYQTEIWRKLIRIPYGKVISYQTLGGSSRYSRAAGTANGRNPVFWIIPCHRVIRADGSFDRYFWGEEVKKSLLAWEFANDGN